MKLIIDIDEETYKKCKWKNNGVVGLEWWERAIANGTPIPDNPTNGDVLKALFPNERIGHCDDCTDLGDIATFDDDWWNAPYQKGGKE